MEHYKIVDGPSLRNLELALFGDSYNKPTPVAFVVHDDDGQGDGIRSHRDCLIESCRRADTGEELWNFTGILFPESRGLAVKGQFSTRDRKGQLEIGKPEELFDGFKEFLDLLRVELHAKRLFEDRKAEVRVCLGDTTISSVKVSVSFGPGADGKIYAELVINETGQIVRR